MGKSGTVEQSPSTSAGQIWNKDQPATIDGNAAQPFARVRPGADRIHPRAGTAPRPDFRKCPRERRPQVSRVRFRNIISDACQVIVPITGTHPIPAHSHGCGDQEFAAIACLGTAGFPPSPGRARQDVTQGAMAAAQRIISTATATTPCISVPAVSTASARSGRMPVVTETSQK